MDYSKMWAARMVEEAELYANNAFVTLTYNNEHLPWRRRINEQTGEMQESNPLVRADLVAFIKRLRENYARATERATRPPAAARVSDMRDLSREARIRYYACGEYGGKKGRPHYHVALFNFNAAIWEDLKLIGNNHQGDAYFTSPTLEKLWGKGFITIGELTTQSAAYIARYMLKKQKGPEGKEYYFEQQGIIPEFTSSSRMPGIGLDWYNVHEEDIWKRDCVYLPQRNRGPLKVKVPRYYEKKFEEGGNEDRLKAIKDARKRSAELASDLKASRTTLSIQETLKVEEAKQLKRSQKLIRSYEVPKAK